MILALAGNWQIARVLCPGNINRSVSVLGTVGVVRAEDDPLQFFMKQFLFLFKSEKSMSLLFNQLRLCMYKNFFTVFTFP